MPTAWGVGWSFWVDECRCARVSVGACMCLSVWTTLNPAPVYSNLTTTRYLPFLVEKLLTTTLLLDRLLATLLLDNQPYSAPLAHRLYPVSQP